MRVIVATSTTTLNTYHSGEQYGDWSDTYDFSIDRVVIDETGEAPTPYGTDAFLIPDDSKVAYVIHMTYSSGDSFGSSSGSGDVLHVFGNAKVAETAFDAIQAQKDNYSFEFLDDFGNLVKVSNNGAGYFESIESLELTPYSLDGAASSRKVTF